MLFLGYDRAVSSLGCVLIGWFVMNPFTLPFHRFSQERNRSKRRRKRNKNDKTFCSASFTACILRLFRRNSLILPSAQVSYASFYSVSPYTSLVKICLYSGLAMVETCYNTSPETTIHVSIKAHCYWSCFDARHGYLSSCAENFRDSRFYFVEHIVLDRRNLWSSTAWSRVVL